MYLCMYVRMYEYISVYAFYCLPLPKLERIYTQSRASAAGLGGAGGGGGMANINERTLEECWSTLQRVS